MSLEEIRKQFAADAAPYQKVRNSSNNSFGAFVGKDDTYRLVGKWVCHGWLKAYNTREHSWTTGGVKYVLSAVMCPHVSDADLRLFISWLVSRSPWKDIFIDKDVDSILKYGYLVDANNPARFIASALVASRFVTESYTGGSVYERRCKVWRELIDMGVTENEAFAFAQMYDAASDKALYPISPSRLSVGHSVFLGSNYHEDYVNRFLRATPFDVKGDIMSSGQGYAEGSLCNIWGSDKCSDAFWTKVSKLAPRSRAKGVDHNIFRAVSKHVWQYNSRGDFMSVIGQLKELLNA